VQSYKLHGEVYVKLSPMEMTSSELGVGSGVRPPFTRLRLMVFF